MKAKYEGMSRQVYCPRERLDCESISQIIAVGHSSFVCVGNVAEHERTIPQDKYRLCWKNAHVDEMGDYDKRDLVHTAAVIMASLAVIEEEE